MRIGKRFAVKCGPISVGNELLSWKKEADYLGVTISASVNFHCSWQSAKKRFFVAINKILSALGSFPDLVVALSLYSNLFVFQFSHMQSLLLTYPQLNCILLTLPITIFFTNCLKLVISVSLSNASFTVVSCLSTASMIFLDFPF